MKWINILPHVPVVGFLAMVLSDKVFCKQTTVIIVLSSVLQAAFVCTAFLGVMP